MTERGRHATTNLFDETATLIRDQLAADLEAGAADDSVFTYNTFFRAANLDPDSVAYNLQRIEDACGGSDSSAVLMAFQMGWMIGRQEAMSAIPTEGSQP